MNSELAAKYLKEMSADVRVALILDGEGRVEASTAEPVSSRVPRLVEALFDQARRAAGEDRGNVERVEVATPVGEVFCVRAKGRTVVAVTGRFALPSLMFYDMREMLRDLEPAKDGRS